jgi:ParB/RepB/Spo0J family partition protein
MNKLQVLPIEKIRRPKICLRPLRLSTIEYVELVESIREHDLLQPILVRPGHFPGEFEIVDGWHRYSASREAGLVEIPCLIRSMTDREVMVYQLMCNSMGPETRPFEYARRLKLLMEDGCTLPELSALTKKSTSWIKNILKLVRVCKEARDPIERGEIKMTAALALANLPPQLQTKFLDDAISMSATEFCERAKAALRDYKSYLLRVRQEDREDGAADPKIRSLADLKGEAITGEIAPQVLKAAKAKTPLDGWMTCLAWIFRLDPLSVQRRKSNYKEKHHPAVTTAEFHKMNRAMIRKFVKPQSRNRRKRND